MISQVLNLKLFFICIKGFCCCCVQKNQTKRRESIPCNSLSLKLLAKTKSVILHFLLVKYYFLLIFCFIIISFLSFVNFLLEQRYSWLWFLIMTNLHRKLKMFYNEKELNNCRKELRKKTFLLIIWEAKKEVENNAEICPQLRKLLLIFFQ